MILLLGISVLEIIFGDYLYESKLGKLNLIRNRTIVYDLNGIYSSNQSAVYKRDKFGLRGFYTSPSEITILTLGGSTTDQRFVSEGLTWQDQMRKIWLNHNLDLQVVNAGVDGQSTYGHIKNFTWWFPHIPNLKPKFILAYIGINDLFGNVGTKWDAIEDASQYLKTLPAEEVNQLPELKEMAATSENSTPLWLWFKKNSALVTLYRKIIGIIQAQKVKLNHGRGFQRTMANWTTKPKLKEYFPLVEKDLSAFHLRLKMLIAEIKKLKARPIIVTQPANYYMKKNGQIYGFNDPNFFFKDKEVSGVDIYYLLQLFSIAAIEECSADSDCIGIDGFENFNLTPLDYYDNVHNTPSGARKIAEVLINKLTPFVRE